MSDEARKNVFAEAMERDVKGKYAAVRGMRYDGGIQDKPKPEPAKARSERFQGRRQVNFGIDEDTDKALTLAKGLRRQKYSDIINAALREHLSDELAMLEAKGEL